MRIKILIFCISFLVLGGGLFFLLKSVEENNQSEFQNLTEIKEPQNPEILHELSIQKLIEYVPQDQTLKIVQDLGFGTNYKKYLASYESEGNLIYGLLTIPTTPKPEKGFPIIIFNHGYIPPKQYSTTGNYVYYTDYFSRNGYILFKPDYRGHGNSQGEARGGYGYPDYTIDVINAMNAAKSLPDADSEKIGMWGHSMGAFITLRILVSKNEIKVADLWGGVVADYYDLFNSWRRRSVSAPTNQTYPGGGWRDRLSNQFGEPSRESEFWQSISANYFLENIQSPVLIQHSTTDETVPVAFSRKLYEDLKILNKNVGYIEYPGDDHNISRNLNRALQKSIEHFDKYLKN